MFSGSSRAGFERQLEKATSSLLLEPDWDATLQLCDAVRAKEVTAKFAVATMRKKMFDKNPRVVLYALQVLESCVKNCGHELHEEIATIRFMEDMKDLIKSTNEAVRTKALELLQAWAHAFRNESSLKIIVDTFNTAKVEGYNFPPLREADAMFVAERAPDWVDGERCHTCRVEFGVVQRKHHCRHCGQIYCNKCTTKQVPIPKFGIEKAVRVCEPCYEKLTSKTGGGPASAPGTKESDLPAEYLNSPLAQQSQVPAQKSEIEIQEEEELQLAMALSLDEAENKHLLKKDGKSSSGSATVTTSSSPSSTYGNTAGSSAPSIDSDLDPELARYLNRPYWEQKHEETKTTAVATAPSAPVGGTDPTPATAPPMAQVTSQPIYAQSGNRVQEQLQNGEVNDDEDFLRAVSGNIEVFLNRMRSNESRGRSIASDTTVQGLFQTLSNMHPQLLKVLHDREERRAQMETLQDKLAQIRDAREALDALREDHREKLRREAEEAERIRQIQMAQKLEIMRQKKQEYLQYQQQLALQRLQEQELEMQRRLEQQKQQQQMRQVQYTTPYPGQQMVGAMPPGAGQMLPGQYAQQPQTFSPPNSMQGSPQHAYNTHQPPNYTPQPAHMEQPSTMEAPPGPPGYQQTQPTQQYHQSPTQHGAGVPQGSYGGPGQYQSPGYNSLSSVDYQNQQQPGSSPYNMQAMSSALPTTQPQNPPPAGQQQYIPPQPPQQGGMYPQGADMQYVPPPQQQQQQPPGQQPPPQQPPPQDEGTLISFD